MSIRKPNMTPCKTPMPMQDAAARIQNREEAALGYTEAQARAEAERCMNCPEQYCTAHCPAHTAIPEFIAEVRGGNYQKAYELIACTNPLMGISSRVCPYECQCESHCTRGIKSEPVAIGRLERFVSDWHRANGTQAVSAVSRKHGKVAVVGSGPAGLTCALSLAKAGFKVTVLEKESELGGVLAWGIPSFVLPPALLTEQLESLRQAGAELKTGIELGVDVTLPDLRARYDAVFLATGAARPTSLSAEGVHTPGVLQAADYLSASEVPAAKRVLVFGGGNTAIDAARAALRSGAQQVQLVYRRTEAEMPATRDEIALAKEEGMGLVELSSPIRFLTEHGTLCGVECETMRLTAPDYPGGRKNTAPTGETITLEADLAVLALGFANEPVDGVALDGANRIRVDEHFATSAEGVYAGGDAVTGASTFMKAAAAGKDAAAVIFNRLS